VDRNEAESKTSAAAPAGRREGKGHEAGRYLFLENVE
jgi:hypothetical protein